MNVLHSIADTQATVLAELMHGYANFNDSTVNNIIKLYDQECVFIDPIKTLSGRDQLHEYFSNMAEGLLECQFTFNHVLHAAPVGPLHEASLFWDMHYRHKKLRGGERLQLAGTSHIKYTDSIVYHRDYYDMGQMLYQHIPLMRQAISVIKKRM